LRCTALKQEDGEDEQLTSNINDVLLNQHFKNEENHDNTVDDEKADKDTTLVEKDKHAKEDEEEKYHVK
jgi:hypothetical protein